VSFTKAASRLFLSIAFSEHLYAAPVTRQCARGYYYREEPVPAVHCGGQCVSG